MTTSDDAALTLAVLALQRVAEAQSRVNPETGVRGRRKEGERHADAAARATRAEQALAWLREDAASEDVTALAEDLRLVLGFAVNFATDLRDWLESIEAGEADPNELREEVRASERMLREFAALRDAPGVDAVLWESHGRLLDSLRDVDRGKGES